MFPCAVKLLAYFKCHVDTCVLHGVEGKQMQQKNEALKAENKINANS